jgi:sec-independent protein translocase protein TatA
MPSGWEWAILVLIALLLIGGSRLPGLGRGAGRAVRTAREQLASLGERPGADQSVAEPVPTPSSPAEPERN